jgi:RsiW-degrading membrane proteinase PrsW (M82 family)
MPSPLASVGLVALGLLPSLIWLGFYYKEGQRKEPGTMMTRAFLMGIIISPLAIILQFAFLKAISFFSVVIEIELESGPFFYLWAAFVEELVKFIAVYIAVIRRPEFDRPIDAMMYMIIGALGFAAIENIMVVFHVIPSGATAAVATLALRFIGATLLHSLASAILGYFLAISWFYQHHMKKFIFIGLTIATILHFIFNMIIATNETQAIALLLTTLLLVGLSLLVSILLAKLRGRNTGEGMALNTFKNA